MFHKPIRTNFKLGPLNGLSGRVGSALDPSTYGDSLDKLLDYFFGRMERYSFCIVRNQNFSLVNITSLKQRASVGYSEIDLGELTSENVVAFTFSLVPRPLQKIERESTYIPLMNHDFIWGRPDKGSEYITITLTNQQCSTWGIDYNNIKHLVYLYNNVGLVTKSFVLHPRGWYTSTIYQPLSHSMLRDKYLTKNLNTLLREVPIGYWIYNKYFWQECSQMIVPRFLTSDFYKYFTVHILRSIPPRPYGYSYSWLFKPTDSGYCSFIEEGLRKVVSVINTVKSPDQIEPELKQSSEFYSAAYLIYCCFEDVASTDEYTEIANFLSVVGGYEGLKKSSVLRLFANIRAAALDLVTSDVQYLDTITEVMRYEE